MGKHALILWNVSLPIKAENVDFVARLNQYFSKCDVGRPFPFNVLPTYRHLDLSQNA